MLSLAQMELLEEEQDETRLQGLVEESVSARLCLPARWLVGRTLSCRIRARLRLRVVEAAWTPHRLLDEESVSGKPFLLVQWLVGRTSLCRIRACLHHLLVVVAAWMHHHRLDEGSALAQLLRLTRAES